MIYDEKYICEMKYGQKKRFHKVFCPVVERLVTALMFHGRNNGKKQMCIRHVEQAMDLIHLSSGGGKN